MIRLITRSLQPRTAAASLRITTAPHEPRGHGRDECAASFGRSYSFRRGVAEAQRNSLVILCVFASPCRDTSTQDARKAFRAPHSFQNECVAHLFAIAGSLTRAAGAAPRTRQPASSRHPAQRTDRTARPGAAPPAPEWRAVRDRGKDPRASHPALRPAPATQYHTGVARQRPSVKA
jgi:hypothetical protein